MNEVFFKNILLRPIPCNGFLYSIMNVSCICTIYIQGVNKNCAVGVLGTEEKIFVLFLQ